MSDYSFYVTTTPPELPQPFGGHRSGRTRANPFDVPVKQSFEQKLAERGEWLEFKVADPAQVRKEVNRIRAAGQFLKLGTEVRVDKVTGRVAFRGTEYKPRGPREKGPDTVGAVTGAAVTTAPDQPTPAGGETPAWDWQASGR
jgi:hypothetical protein